MKVLFVLNGGLGIPGPSNHLIEAIVHETINLGLSVHVIDKHIGTTMSNDVHGLFSDTVTFDRVRFSLAPKHSLFRRYLADLRYTLACSKHFKNHKDASVVFLQSSNVSPFLIFWLRLFVKKPIVYNVQDIWPVNAMMVGILRKSSLSYKLFSWLQKYAYNKADIVVTISEDMRDTLIREGVASRKIEVVHNWSYSDEAPFELMSQNQFIKRNNVDMSIFNVVYAGNIGVFQNVDIVIKAAELLSDHADIRFHIIGEGARKAQLEDYVKTHRLSNVVFYPMQPSEIALDIYQMASVNIIPLAGGVIYTALPSKTAICLASGRPLIACVDIESRFAKMISNCDQCAVAPPNDPEKLAELIYQFYQTNNDQRSLDTQLLFRSEFSRGLNSRKYASILSRIANLVC